MLPNRQSPRVFLGIGTMFSQVANGTTIEKLTDVLLAPLYCCLHHPTGVFSMVGQHLLSLYMTYGPVMYAACTTVDTWSYPSLITILVTFFLAIQPFHK